MKLLFTFTILFIHYIYGTLSYPAEPQKADDMSKEEVEFHEKDHEMIVQDLWRKSLGNPDITVGEAVKYWFPGIGQMNPEEYGTYAQGDILTIEQTPTNDWLQSGISDSKYRWSKGIIHYTIADNFTALERKLIENAFEKFHELTCISFKPLESPALTADYIDIQNGVSGCWSAIGRVGGRQFVNLQAPVCLIQIGTILHELMHAVGFYHEQTREDRNDYVNIVWENIKEETKSNFEEQESNAFGVPYDYKSIMHYSAYAHSKNHLRTIETKRLGERIGQRTNFSELDLKKINLMYKCENKVSLL